MTTATHFTEPEMLNLVLLYRDYDCLWNMTHPKYKDRDTRTKAYQEILEKLNLPNLTASDIPKKIKNLRSSYYQELKRVRKSINQCGPVYKPRVAWFSILDDFLRAFKSERDVFSTISAKTLNGNLPDDDNFNYEIVDTDKNSKTVLITPKVDLESNDPKKRKLSPFPAAPIKIYNPVQEKSEDEKKKERENNDEFNSFGSYIASMPQEFSILAKTELQNYRKTTDNFNYEIVDTDKNSKTVLIAPKVDLESNEPKKRKLSPFPTAPIKIYNPVQEDAKKKERENNDEFNSFGSYIATTLRSMPQEFSIIAKTELQKTLSDIQLRIIRQTNRSALSPFCASTSSENDHPSGCITPTSDSYLSTNIKIEYDDS